MRLVISCFLCLTLPACAADSGDTFSGRVSESDAISGSDVSSIASDIDAEFDTTAPSTTADGVDDAAAPDPMPAPEALTAVDPCGDDLQASCGVISADIVVDEPMGSYPHDLMAIGPLSIQSESMTLISADGADIPITIYWPLDGGLPVDASLPLVILMPGFPASHTDYFHLTEHLVSHGLAVVGADVTTGSMFDPAQHDVDAAKVTDIIDWVSADPLWSSRFDVERVASVGHSAGGKMSFYAASFDERIDLVIGWDPSNSGGPPCFLGNLAGGSCNDFAVAPNCEASDAGRLHLMKAESLIFGARDMTLTPDVHLHADQFYRGAPSPTVFVSMPDVGHGAWATANATSTLSAAVSTAWLLTRLRGAQDLEGWLPTGETLAESPSVLEVLTK